MSQLLPDVSLEEEPAGESEQKDSSTELQNYRTTEASDEQSSEARSKPSQQGAGTSEQREGHGSRSSLSVMPNQRPSLRQKLGPYVSDEVDVALEDVYLTLRRRFGGKASKSLIVEAALRYALTDCLKRRENSELVRWFEQVLSGS